MTDRRADPLTATRSADSQAYQQAVDQLRARGCRCVLRWNGVTAVPLTPGDAETCHVVHAEE